MEYNQDETYIERIKAGDLNSYRYLVDKYKDMAFTIALKIVKDREDAQDVIQESFIKAFQQLDSFQGRSKFSTWLYKIVYRTALNQIKNKEKDNFSFDDLEGEIPDSKNNQLQQLQEKDQQDSINKAINKLPKEEALLITLFYINENSIKEIKEITGLSLSNIKIKLFRARKELKKDLAMIIDCETKNN